MTEERAVQRAVVRAGAAAGLLGLVAVGVVRAVRFVPRPDPSGADASGEGRATTPRRFRSRPPLPPEQDASASRAAARLGELVRIPTVSPEPGEDELDRFDELAERLETFYPLVHAALERERLAGHSLLFRWRGVSAGRPLVLLAHSDVVPVEPGGWKGDPFSGETRDGAVWGRGALDDKGSLVVILEAVESLLREGWQPDQDVYLSFGHDEETASEGARSAVAALAERGVTPWLVVDEGGAVVEGVLVGVPGPTAVVGIAEKGVLDLEISTQDLGGHASTPSRGGATARLARAILRVEAAPFPVRLPRPTLEMVDTLGRYAPLGPRLLFANAPTLRPVLARLLARGGPEANAMVRTTVAITQLEGSPGANVAAASARAVANVRIASGETVESVVERLRRVIADPRVQLRVLSGEDPSPVSPTRGEPWELVRSAIGAAYPDAIVAPYLMLGASDGRHFCAISDHVYRFSPFAMTRRQRESVHGVDEHVTVEALGRGVMFYREVLRGLPRS